MVLKYNNFMKFILIIFLFIITYFFPSQVLAKTKFELSGFSIGMVLTDKLSKTQISEGVYRKYYNENYITTLEFDKSTFFPEYDYTQFSFKKKDKKQKIIAIEAVKDYEDNIAECFAKREEIIADISSKYKKIIIRIDDMGTEPFSKSFAKGTRTTTWIDLKGKKYVYVSCYNFADTESRQDQLRIGINNTYFDKMAFK